MAVLNFRRAEGRNQVPKSGYPQLEYILDSLDDQPLVDTLEQYHRTGRKGYPVRAMLRAYFAKFILKIRFNNQLLERLRGSRRLREICGFGDEVPIETAMSRFTVRLADHQDLVEQCFVSITGALWGVVPTLKYREGSSPSPCRRWGRCWRWTPPS